jgi:hypothetical protein
MQFGMVMTLIGVVLLLRPVATIIRSRIARKPRGSIAAERVDLRQRCCF